MHIHQEQLLDAIALFNAVAHQRTRKFEFKMVKTYGNHDEVMAMLQAARSVPQDKVVQFDGVSRFQRDAQRVMNLLDGKDIDGKLLTDDKKIFSRASDGSYYHHKLRMFLRSPRRIANELVEEGYIWVNAKHVEEAQRVKAPKAA